MTDQEILAKFTRILRDLLLDDSIELTMETRREDVPNWDSVQLHQFHRRGRNGIRGEVQGRRHESFPMSGRSSGNNEDVGLRPTESIGDAIRRGDPASRLRFFARRLGLAGRTRRSCFSTPMSSCLCFFRSPSSGSSSRPRLAPWAILLDHPDVARLLRLVAAAQCPHHRAVDHHQLPPRVVPSQVEPEAATCQACRVSCWPSASCSTSPFSASSNTPTSSPARSTTPSAPTLCFCTSSCRSASRSSPSRRSPS